MIAVDTSALMAILLQEPEADSCALALLTERDIVVSAATMAEALIVAHGRDRAPEMARLFDELNIRVVPVTEVAARRVAQAYARWGKGVHPAALNYGDCFSYAVALEQSCPLLYIGSDFAKTDVMSAR